MVVMEVNTSVADNRIILVGLPGESLEVRNSACLFVVMSGVESIDGVKFRREGDGARSASHARLHH